MCHRDKDWTRSLSTVLLGLRSHVRSDSNASPAEFVFRTTSRLPGEFFLPDDITPDPNIFIEEHREHMRQVRPVPAAHHNKSRAFVYKTLYECTHVFMRNMAKKALERPYTGPHRVLSRPCDRVFTIDVNGTTKYVSIELLKPAYLVNQDLDDTS
ncbi:uncharacterized protein LOC143218886 [Lasioglossum baleicum]|uniref:uncharacterized protein LOC143218886 n=1 Tax=Lasioglossum baleicum TaxID=434251 RepID=UPI003FCC6A55